MERKPRTAEFTPANHTKAPAMSRKHNSGQTSSKGQGGRSQAGKSQAASRRGAPPTRKDKILKAKQLLQSAHYPSDKVVDSVAKLLARNWRRLRRLTHGSAR